MSIRLLLSLCLILVSTSVRSAPLSSLGGEIKHLTYEEGRLYVTKNNRALEVYEVQNPTSPKLLGRYVSSFEGRPWDKNVSPVAIIGTKAFYVIPLEGSQSALEVVDVSDPKAMKRSGWVYVYGRISELHSFGNYLLLNGNSIQIFDISGNTPKLVSQFKNGNPPFFYTEYFASAIRGNLLYTAYNASLLTLDLSDPKKPVLLNTYELPENPSKAAIKELSIEGDKLAVVSGENGFSLLSLSDPLSPKILGKLGSTPKQPFLHVRLNGETAWVLYKKQTMFPSVYYLGVQTLDLSDPSHPKVLADLPNRAEYWQSSGFAGNRKHLFWSEFSQGIAVTDVTQVKSIQPTGKIETLNAAGDICFPASSQNIGYGVDELSGKIQTLDISTPASAELRQSLPIVGRAKSVACLGSQLYVSVEKPTTKHLEVWDVSNPTKPTLSSVALKESAYRSFGRVQKGEKLLVQLLHDLQIHTGGTSVLTGITGFELQGTEPPKWLGRIQSYWGETKEVALHKNYVYFPRQKTLAVVDLTRKTGSMEVMQLPLSNEPFSIATDGKFLYLTEIQTNPANQFVFEVIDIADPEKPKVVTTKSFDGSVGTLAVENGIAYVGSKERKIRLIDLSNPLNPVLKQTWDDIFMGAVRILPHHGLLFVSHPESDFKGHEGGISIFELSR